MHAPVSGSPGTAPAVPSPALSLSPALLFLLVIGWIAWPTDELRGPTTPMTSLSPVSFVAAFLPASGLA